MLTCEGVGPHARAGGGALRSATGRVNEVRGREPSGGAAKVLVTLLDK